MRCTNGISTLVGRHEAPNVRHGAPVLVPVRAKGDSIDVPSRNDLPGLRYGREMTEAAQRYGIEPKLLAAVAAQESGQGGLQAHNIDQRGGLGRGPFQIDIGAWPKQASIAHDPVRSARFAASLLKDGFRQADLAHDAERPVDRIKEALRTYNASSPHARTTLTLWPDGKIPYEESVLRHYHAIESIVAKQISPRC